MGFNMSDLFYKTCRHGNCGSNVMFHNKNERGYGTDLKNLEVYDLETAQREQDYQDGSWLLSKTEVDKLAVKHVDMQYLDRVIGEPSNMDDLCVVQINGEYDGNDIQFSADIGLTFDLSKARVVSYQFALGCADKNKTIWLKSYIDSISRDTFQSYNINKRKMMTNYGLRYRTPKPKGGMGKTRGNCPSCGKITWSYNPYESDYCDSMCK